jgi:hypothetical protein
MALFTIMGSHPGDGAQVEAQTFKEAFKKFCCLDHPPEEHSMIRAEVEKEWPTYKKVQKSPLHLVVGDYEINAVLTDIEKDLLTMGI